MSGFGCLCGSENWSGLGAVPSGAVPTSPLSSDAQQFGFLGSAFSAAWSGAMKILNAVENVFGIGDGRREADIIVPVQNTIVTGPGVTPPGRLNVIVAAYPTADLPTLINFYNELQATGVYFTKFCKDPRFTDGRASAKALADVIPLINDNIQKIGARITSLGGTVPAPGSGITPGGSVAIPGGGLTLASMEGLLVPAVIIGAIWFAAKKR